MKTECLQLIRIEFDDDWKFEHDGARTIATVSTQAAEKLIPKLAASICAASTDTSDIKRAVCLEFKITPNEMNSDTRPTHIAFPRQVAMWLHRAIANLSFEDIGARFPKRNGKPRNHGTAMHACRTVEKAMTKDPEMRARIMAIMERLQKKEPTE